jgi:hypothetical protein
MDYYLSFIKALDPDLYRHQEVPEWISWGSGTGQRLELQTNATQMEHVPQAQAHRCSYVGTARTGYGASNDYSIFATATVASHTLVVRSRPTTVDTKIARE